jgi:type II secretory pathway pseudopilin PulG
MVEVMISVVLLSVFSVAAMLVVTSGTAASADNRARITAAGLAQRELDLVSQVITGSPNGAQLVVGEGEVTNPNLVDELSATPGGIPTSDFPFALDGQKYKIVRNAAAYDTAVKSPCSDGSGVEAAQGVQVTVTVAWEGMGAGTSPHVVSKVFPPGRRASAGIPAGQAQIVVRIQGSAQGADYGPRPSIRVEVTGPDVLTPSVNTNSVGCAVISVVPAPAGSSYTVTLGGYQGGSAAFVNPAGNPSPSQNVGAKPDQRVQVQIENYSEVATLKVNVINATEAVQMVWARPWSPEGGGDSAAALVNGVATFAALAPGKYDIMIGGVTYDEVDLVSGPNTMPSVVL